MSTEALATWLRVRRNKVAAQELLIVSKEVHQQEVDSKPKGNNTLLSTRHARS